MYRPSPFLKAVNQPKKSNTTSSGKNDNGEQLRSPFFFVSIHQFESICYLLKSDLTISSTWLCREGGLESVILDINEKALSHS